MKGGGVSSQPAAPYNTNQLLVYQGEHTMSLYMTQFAYTADAWAALINNPVDRGQAFQQLAQKLGARMVNLYYCFGEYDGVLIIEAPDDTTATALILAAIAPGHVKSTKTTRLLTVEETMEAMRKAGGMSYQGPTANS
jgi:uncharacterized protein with GYD domain